MTGKARWLAARLGNAVVVVFGVATASFLAVHLAPGDPVRTLLGPQALTGTVEQVRHELGYDQPLLTQYLRFLGSLLHGDLGTSYQLQEPVSRLILSQIGSTAQLAVAGFVLAMAVAVGLAIATSGRRPFWRRVSSLFELIATASPTFWTGIVLLTIFSFHLNLFPAAGAGLRGLVLPAVTLALSLVGVFTQMLRQGMEQALDQPFTLSARARGVGETSVRATHALRHALIPVVTLSGWVVGNLLGGAVVVETLFTRQGIGQIMAAAIASRDLPVVTGVTIVSAVIFIVVNLVVDVVYHLVDPRLRTEGRA